MRPVEVREVADLARRSFEDAMAVLEVFSDNDPNFWEEMLRELLDEHR